MVKFEPSESVNICEFTNMIYLHFRMIFRNTIQQKNLKDCKKIADVLRKIVEETEIPDLPQTSISYKIMGKIIQFVDWKKIAVDCLNDLKKPS